MATVVSFRRECIDIPTSKVALALTLTPHGRILSVSMPAFSEMELPPDAVAFAEVFHPSLSGSSYSLGRVSQHAEGLYRDVLMPDFPSPSKAGVRIVVRHPTEPYFVARTERLSPAIRDPGEFDGAGHAEGRSFVQVKEDENLELPWAALPDQDYPLIVVNPRYLRKGDLRSNPVRVVDVLPAAVQVFALALLRHPGKYVSPHWRAFQNRAVALMGADTWECLTDTPGLDEFLMAAEIAAAFFNEGGMRLQVEGAFRRMAERERA